METQDRTYDELGVAPVADRRLGAELTVGYDKVGNVVSVTDPRQNLFGYAYDGLNRLISLTDEGSAVTTLARSAPGDVAAHTDANWWPPPTSATGWGEVIHGRFPAQQARPRGRSRPTGAALSRNRVTIEELTAEDVGKVHVDCAGGGPSQNDGTGAPPKDSHDPGRLCGRGW